MELTLLLPLLLLLAWRRADASKEVMGNLHLKFRKALADCIKEQNLPETVVLDFYHFWKEDFQLSKRETGCAIICLSHKLQLLDPDGKLHHGNAKEFALSHGADDKMADTLVQLIHGCEQAAGAQADECARVMQVAQCFKDKIHELDWAPNLDVVVAEVLSEVE